MNVEITVCGIIFLAYGQIKYFNGEIKYHLLNTVK